MLLRLVHDPSINAKAWYVFYFAASVSVGPFLNVYFKEIGLSKAQVGLIGALTPWTSAPASFAWAALADRLGAHRAVLLGCWAACVCVRLLLLLPRHFGALLAVTLAAEVLGSPVGVMADAAIIHMCAKESDYGKYRLWGAVGWGSFSTVAGWLITTGGIRWAFYTHALLALPTLLLGTRLRHASSPPPPPPPAPAHGPGPGPAGPTPAVALPSGPGLGDEEEGEEEEEGDEAEEAERGRGRGKGRGREREQDPLLPVTTDTLKHAAVSHRHAHSHSAGPADSPSSSTASIPSQPKRAPTKSHRSDGGLAPASPAAPAGPGPGPGGALDESPQEGVGSRTGAGAGVGAGEYWRHLSGLLRRPEVVLFLVTATIMGYGFGTIDSFLFLYLQQMGATGTLMGLTLTVTCMAEVPAFQLQDRLLDSWGVTAALDLVQLVYVLRLALYTLLPRLGAVAWVLPIEVLHGVTFALGWGAGTVNCKLLAAGTPLAATLQGTFQGLYFGLGYGLGALVGGLVGSALGWQRMFGVASCALLVLWGLGLAARRCLGVTLTGRAARGPGYVELRTLPAGER
ncbi:hypothetical protein HYH03_002240 [Edaphochlamys debaryana]|uniref:Major facilitator superfamily (MFS) profile domain-containing protein n=1 Tax=Edaphochlamys debaryana TaxID=47281 RepID=A0A835YJX8_9CHLO|nr:hypothetical protein HYH03_002240 [Edaphochlamys debaryana]|eukprot:KAG2499955.1 hypothetical protein HYH03_002240 [Edaphochlamys debaryana]